MHSRVHQTEVVFASPGSGTRASAIGVVRGCPRARPRRQHQAEEAFDGGLAIAEIEWRE